MATNSSINEQDSIADGRDPDPGKWPAYGIITLFATILPAILITLFTLMPPPKLDPWTEAAAFIGADRAQVYNGAQVFRKGCAVCHGKDAQGVPRLGKPLRNSEFVQEHNDDELFQVISQGRLPTDQENTTGALMPPRANQGLSDNALRDVIVFIRTIQDPSQPFTPTDDWIIDLATSSGANQAAGVAGVGHDLFVSSCSACHGATGEGLEGLGKPLAKSPFIDQQSDKDLMNFIKSGRPIWDALNTTGVDMPPKGGNPAITDEQIEQIIQYLRALHDNTGA